MPTFTSSTFGKYLRTWLIGVGIFEMLLAAAFVAAAVLVPLVRVGFFLTAGFLGLTGIVLIVFGIMAGRRAAQADRIDATGIAGQATVVGLTQTGMRMNDNPQVEMDLLVDVPGRTPYRATRKEFVPLILLGRLSSGTPLPVKVDAADPSNVIIDWDSPVSVGFGSPAPSGFGSLGSSVFGSPAPAPFGMTGAPPGSAPVTASDETLNQVLEALRSSGLQAATPIGSAEQGQYGIEQLRDHLRVYGIPGTATINQLEDSGRTVGDERMFTMQVTVQVAGRAPHQGAPSVAMVPLSAASKVAVGKTIPVRVAVDNPGLVMFEWEKI